MQITITSQDPNDDEPTAIVMRTGRGTTFRISGPGQVVIAQEMTFTSTPDGDELTSITPLGSDEVHGDDD